MDRNIRIHLHTALYLYIWHVDWTNLCTVFYNKQIYVRQVSVVAWLALKKTQRLDLNKKYLIGLFSTQSWLMLRPWLLQGNELVIVLLPRKTDIIWIVLASEVWTDLQRRRESNQVCLWEEPPHSYTVRVALASSNWRSEKVSAVQYSIVWQFLLRPSFQLTIISDLLDCVHMICTECHTFIHLSLLGQGSGEVSRESIQEDLRIPLQPL